MPLIAGAALAACAPRAPTLPVPESPEAARHRAALAILMVRNDTAEPLRIGYRPAAAAGGVVMVGRVAARDSARMAPVPAGDPLLLRAVDPRGRILVTPPRTFDVDEVWTWRITTQAVFVDSGEVR